MTEINKEKEYELALMLMGFHVETFWHHFNSFLLTETVLVGFILAAIAEMQLPKSNLLVFMGAVLGLVICFPWWATASHDNTYYLLRIMQARRHERELGLSLLDEGKIIRDGKQLTIDQVKLRHPLIARILPPSVGLWLLILLFGLILGFIAFMTGPWWP